MEYFDFQDASEAHALPPLDVDELSSLYPNYNQDEVSDCYDSLFFDKSHPLPADTTPVPPQGPVKLKLINDIEIEVIPQPDDPTLDYPMFRAKRPCDLCARMGLDCFLASRGSMITGCTCCISLYKECSFTHPKLPKGFVNNFNPIKETEAETSFGRHHAKSLRSFDEARVRKTGARFPRDAVKILKQWLAEHSEHPYPNEREKDDLKQLTGLKRSQISNWLANARRRGKVRPAEHSGPSSPMLGAIDIPPQKNNISELNPLDRWKASPPENEPASMTAIARAVTSTPLPHSASHSESSSLSLQHGSDPHSRGHSRQNSSSGSTNFSMFREPSISSFDTHSASTASDMTRASSKSTQSRHSFSSGERRRRRRAPMTQRAAAQAATKTRSVRIFQCTFCTDTFPAKYDWQRHEKSLHLALERWTCCPQGGTYTVPSTQLPHCVFCNALNPTAEHLESQHNFLVCQEQTTQERTFYRKDHLRQHLKLRHGAKFDKHMEAWKTTTNEIKSACGFCPSKFTTWSQRADHLAAHFRNGADMKDWANGWGFDAAVERCVENAIPPYLIGHERVTMEPYVARLTRRGPASNPPDAGGLRHTVRRRGVKSGGVGNAVVGSGEDGTMMTPAGGSSGSNGGLTYGTSSASGNPSELGDDDGDGDVEEPDQMTRDSNCWGRLEQELTKYLTQHKLVGSVPSDRQLQDQARVIIYEDDDPWNWTCADNQLWLDTFKWQHGVGGVTEGMVAAGLGLDAAAQVGGGTTAGETRGQNVMLGAAGGNGAGAPGVGMGMGMGMLGGGGLLGHGREGVRLIEQVDVLAPYVIKGGNRGANDGGSSVSGAGARRSKARGKRTTKAVTTERARRGSSRRRRRQGSNATGSSFSSSSSVDFGNTAAAGGSSSMDLDFDGVDFSGLDLGLGATGDEGVAPSLSMSMAAGGASGAGSGYAPATANAGREQDDFFGGEGFELGADASSVGISPLHQQQQNFALGGGFPGPGARQNLGYEHAQMPSMYMTGMDGLHSNSSNNNNNNNLDMGLNMDLNMDVNSMDMEALLGGAPLTKTDTCQTVEGAGAGVSQQQRQRQASDDDGRQGEGGHQADLGFMSAEDIRALEGWTGGLR